MQHASIFHYFLDAGIVVKLVMLLLLAASILSWTLIIQRFRFFKTMQRNYETFKTRFKGSTDLARLFNDIDSRGDEREGLPAIFYAGFKEFLQMSRYNHVDPAGIARVMQINHAHEAERLEQNLAVFASIGAIAPFVGLFGTVWGIMTSFQALGSATQATIAMVAPGISEALVATALGLFTAIPAVIAYNRYSVSANTLLNRYELFQEELLMHVNRMNYVRAPEISDEAITPNCRD